MPRIAEYIAELLKEDKFGTKYMEKLPERLEELNAAQLQGMYNHLKKTSNETKFKPWKKANVKLMNSMKDILDIRINEFNKIENNKIEKAATRRAKQNELDRKEDENEQILSVINNTSYIEAENYILEKEKQRQIDENLEMYKQTWIGEEKRWKYIYRTTFFLIFMLVFVIVINTLALHSTIVIAVGLTVILSLSAYGYYRAYYVAVIVPITVSKEEIDKQIEVKKAEVIERKFKEKEEMDRKYKIREEQEKAYRIEYKKKKVEKLAYEAKLLEERRLEELQMAMEILEAKAKAMAALDHVPHTNSDGDGVNDPVTTISIDMNDTLGRSSNSSNCNDGDSVSDPVTTIAININDTIGSSSNSASNDTVIDITQDDTINECQSVAIHHMA